MKLKKFFSKKGRVYSVQTGMTINKTAADCKTYLLKLMDLVETVRFSFFVFWAFFE